MSRLTGPHQTLSNKGLNPTLSAIQSCPRPFRYLSLSPVIWGRKVTVSRHHYGKRHEQSLGTSARRHESGSRGSHRDADRWIPRLTTLRKIDQFGCYTTRGPS